IHCPLLPAQLLSLLIMPGRPSMFETIEAVSYVKTMGSARTRPVLLLCEAQGDKGTIDAVVKLSAGCELKEQSLMREAIAAFFAIDLGLPVPCPYQVHLSKQFIDTISDTNAQALAAASCEVAFGCHLITGYSTIPKGLSLEGESIEVASEIFAFDVMTGN